jgi:uncharacterized peroxidase-related enzyme
MAHIKLKDGWPGIRGLFAFRSDTGEILSQLAQVLLHDPNTLYRAERELIATHVSFLNDCHYCQASHGAIAAHHLYGDEELVDRVKRDPDSANINPKLRALLNVAGKVQDSGKSVLSEDVEAARREGATDREIHDTVLIAAAFCMYNRYVDGLATFTPLDQESYRERAAGVAQNGYLRLPRMIAEAEASAVSVQS